MLTVSILVDYYQELLHDHLYIYYEEFLARNERIIKKREEISEVLKQNGCEKQNGCKTFFGFKTIDIYEKPLCEIIYMVKKRYKQ